MAVTSDHIYYTGDTAYDLRKILSMSVDGANTVVYFENCPTAPVLFATAAFEVAKQNSLDNGG